MGETKEEVRLPINCRCGHGLKRGMLPIWPGWQRIFEDRLQRNVGCDSSLNRCVLTRIRKLAVKRRNRYVLLYMAILNLTRLTTLSVGTVGRAAFTVNPIVAAFLTVLHYRLKGNRQFHLKKDSSDKGNNSNNNRRKNHSRR